MQLSLKYEKMRTRANLNRANWQQELPPWTARTIKEHFSKHTHNPKAWLKVRLDQLNELIDFSLRKCIVSTNNQTGETVSFFRPFPLS